LFYQGNGFNISWDPPQDTCGFEILHYNIYRNEINNPENVVIKTTENEFYIDYSIVPGINYSYWISAITLIGEGLRSESISGRFLNQTSEPIYFNASPGDEFINLSWESPLNIGDGVRILHYRIYRNDTLYSHASLAGWFNDTGLANGVTYSYYICAVTDIGEGLYSRNLIAIPIGLPGPPLNISIIPQGVNIHITWTDPISDEGSPIVGYLIRREINNNLIETFEVKNRTFLDEDAPRGIQISYYIACINGVGIGDYSEGIIITLDEIGVPSKPISITINLTSEGICLLWLEPLEDGGSEIIEYNIYKKRVNNTNYIKITSVTTLEYIDTDYHFNSTYHYKITAVNVHGESAYSEEVSIYVSDLPDFMESKNSKDNLILYLIFSIILIGFIGFFTLFLLIKMMKKSNIKDHYRSSEE
jgi:hypothetical protein